MATKEKESSTLKKGRKVTSPSDSHTNVKQGCLKPTTSGSTYNKPTPSGKPFPNYLKPTISSRLESFKYVKKTGQADATQKATLLRRRSFDQPPSVSRIQRALISPDPKERAASRDGTIAARPTATSSKSTPLPKPALKRSSRSLKPIKSQAPAARTLTRSLSPSNRSGHSAKNGSSSSVSPEPPSDDHISQSLDLKINQESSKESLVDDVEETPNFEGKVLVLSSDIPQTEDKEHIDAADTEVKNGEDEKLKPCAIPTVSEGNQNAQIEVPEIKLQEDSENQRGGEETKSNDEGAEGRHEEDIADEANVEVDQDKVEENVDENVAFMEQPVGEKKQEDKNQVNEGSKEIKSKEGQDAEESIVAEVKPGEATGSGAQNRRGGQEKKESPAAYNDVIEETKKKLLQTRKNKVKALVGAFETVIDYESSSK